MKQQLIGLAVGTACFGVALATIPSKPLESKRAKAKVTYAEHVAPIINRQCVPCHQPGQVAPFSLVGYENAKKWAPMIVRTTQSKQMPPWKAEPGYGEFLDARVLTAEELNILKDWKEGGTNRGDAKKEPKVALKTNSWPLGKPDLELKPSRSYTLGAEGDDVYRNFVLDYKFDQPTYIRAMDVQPGNNKIVHHVIAFIDNKGAADRLEAKSKDGQPGYLSFGGPGFAPAGSLGGWAPGTNPFTWGPGKGMLIKPGSKIVLQVHYHKSGKIEQDLTKIGLYFQKGPVDTQVDLMWLMRFNIDIPAGKANHEEVFKTTLPTDITLYGVMPHMHLLGRKMEAKAELPDGSTVPLIRINDWDFNWQINYGYRKPLELPKGTKLTIRAVYDNSTDNPRNPSNPPKRVTWGEQTTDEMFLMIGAYSVKDAESKRAMRRYTMD